MQNLNLSTDQHNLIERLYHADHVFTKADFDDPKKMVPFLSELRKIELIEWNDIGNWTLKISEKGKAYYESYIERKKYEERLFLETQKANKIAKRANLYSIIALLIALAAVIVEIIR